MTVPADRLRHLLAEAASTANVNIYPDVLAAICDAQMRIFEQVTVQSRKTVDDTGRLTPQHRLVAMTGFEPAKDTPDA
jgi:hypothetical protein